MGYISVPKQPYHQNNQGIDTDAVLGDFLQIIIRGTHCLSGFQIVGVAPGSSAF
ncbi:hypothetical protein [Sodalis sp.]|uniref:hypothetical protein n=1 Tax=Sodalis sp. (in: enterobacteria) TaxID=1898979 RepID=UPI003873B386